MPTALPPIVQRHPWALRLLMPAVLALALPQRAAAEEDWSIAKVEGQEYVPVENFKQFYGFHTATREGNSVTLSSADEVKHTGILLKLQIGSQECLINNVKFILTCAVASGGKYGMISRMDLAKLFDPVLRPDFIDNAGNFRTVILDPGHGDKDSGALSPYGTEANFALALGLQVKALLEKDSFKVVMTRSTSHFLSLQERVEVANAVKEDAIFISLHFNEGGSEARGIETFTLSPPGVAHYGSGIKASDGQMRRGNEHDSANIALATAVHGSVLRRLGTNTFDRGIKRARWSVLSGVSHPAILFEGGFMSHPYESRLIANDKYQAALAHGIEDAVLRYQRAISHKVLATARDTP